MKNILVTGAAGFIGANFVHYLLENYSDIFVVGLDKLTYAGNKASLFQVEHKKNFIFLKEDICNQKSIELILEKHQINCLVHFAAESHVDNSISGPEVFIQSNIVGTFSLLEACKNIWSLQNNFSQCRFHHISTDEVFGSLEINDPAFTESSLYKPNSPYSASKASSDHLVRAYFQTFKLPISISNCSNNFGPFQHHEKFIPTIIRSCLNNTHIPIYGDGTNIRDWLYVGDHINAIDLILKKGRVGQTYNIGGNFEIDNLSLVKKVCNIMNKLVPSKKPYQELIQFVEDRKGHDWRYAINCKKLKQELNWCPTDNFDRLLEQTIKFYIR